MQKPERTNLTDDKYALYGSKRVRLYAQATESPVSRPRVELRRNGGIAPGVNIYLDEIDDVVTYLLYYKAYAEEQNDRSA